MAPQALVPTFFLAPPHLYPTSLSFEVTCRASGGLCSLSMVKGSFHTSLSLHLFLGATHLVRQRCRHLRLYFNTGPYIWSTQKDRGTFKGEGTALFLSVASRVLPDIFGPVSEFSTELSRARMWCIVQHGACVSGFEVRLIWGLVLASPLTCFRFPPL